MDRTEQLAIIIHITLNRQIPPGVIQKKLFDSFLISRTTLSEKTHFNTLKKYVFK